jgi:hypothetical protein
MIAATFQKNVELWKKDKSRDVYISIGFHQETALKFLPALRQGIDAIRQAAERETLPVEFVVPALKL